MTDYSKVRALIITGVGLNCEKETAAAFESAGATAEQVHLNDLLNGKRKLDEFHILAFIGGFSFGDQAVVCGRDGACAELRRAVRRGDL